VSLTALLAATAIASGAADPGATAEFVAPDSFGGVTTAGALFYTTTQSQHAAIRRLDLVTGETRIVFTAGDRRTDISALQAGGGRVGFETELGLRASRMYAMDASSGAVTEVARGRSIGRRPCGREFKLDDVASTGELVFQDVTSSCTRPYHGKLRVRVFDPPIGIRTLSSFPRTDAFISDGPPFRRLAGSQLLTFGDHVARVRDLESGDVRRFRTRGPRFHLGDADVARDGRVFLSVWGSAFPGAFPPLQTIRLLGPSDEGLEGSVVHRTRSDYGTASFCGGRAVLYAQNQRGRFRLTLLDPRFSWKTGVLPEPDVETACEDRFVATVMVGGGQPDMVFTYELPAG
jgi:hypothetical protein